MEQEMPIQKYLTAETLKVKVFFICSLESLNLKKIQLRSIFKRLITTVAGPTSNLGHATLTVHTKQIQAKQSNSHLLTDILDVLSMD